MKISAKEFPRLGVTLFGLKIRTTIIMLKNQLSINLHWKFLSRIRRSLLQEETKIEWMWNKLSLGRARTTMVPPAGSTILKRASVRLLFPAPVRPTMPTFWPPSISKDTSLRIKSRPSLKGKFKRPRDANIFTWMAACIFRGIGVQKNAWESNLVDILNSKMYTRKQQLNYFMTLAY